MIYQSETALAAGFPAVLDPPPLARTRRTPFDLPGSPVNLQHRAAGDDMPHTPHVPVVNDDGAFRARVDRDALRSRDVYRKLHRLTFSFAPLLPAGVARSVRLLVPPRHAGPTSTHPQFLAWAAHLRECRQGRDVVDILGVGISLGYCGGAGGGQPVGKRHARDLRHRIPEAPHGALRQPREEAPLALTPAFHALHAVPEKV